MRKPRIGMIGLGNIAQKAYLPILTKETDWTLVGAFSPSKEKRKIICNQYRIQDFHSLENLSQACDAIFVHSSTSSHYEVVSSLLTKGLDVYVDKPLAATIHEAEKLVELSEKAGRKLMVGFNRRFAPLYVRVKEQAHNIASVRFEKHRTDSLGPYSYEFRMLDDYLHLVDTIRWLADGDLNVLHGTIHKSLEEYLVYAGHIYQSNQGTLFFTEMHRKAGTNLEKLELLTEGAILRVKNMNTLEIESNNTTVTSVSPSWDTTLKQRGFEDAIQHFIGCIQNDQKPLVDGLEGLKSQRLVEQLIKKQLDK
ncbi:Gfo/Idh/MocA family protein [Thermoflavimicrobium daqui]|uniref:Virulence factor MviM n=1 Tax=Thermoflavimicrobium daqui TaxID=2137476 RepID=A0A364K4A4_9BACL|nr:Gfo/Idh/MocA family oxidoreductase [Thermoflavimicrobium daqui]RAL24121.1 virulence factor MviM [Thermoflavimicrobium daqui]